MPHRCENCGGWCYLEGGEWICLACGKHTDAKGKDQAGIRSKIAKEIEKARKMGLRKRW